MTAALKWYQLISTRLESRGKSTTEQRGTQLGRGDWREEGNSFRFRHYFRESEHDSIRCFSCFLSLDFASHTLLFAVVNFTSFISIARSVFIVHFGDLAASDLALEYSRISFSRPHDKAVASSRTLNGFCNGTLRSTFFETCLLALTSPRRFSIRYLIVQFLEIREDDSGSGG